MAEQNRGKGGGNKDKPKEKTAREKALEFAKNVPKPKVVQQTG